MTPLRYVVAVAVGLILATFPFLRYAHVGGAGESHMNHEPRHGGQLGMVGDHHIEMVQRAGKIEAYVSDAWRRPLRPHGGEAIFDRARTRALEWRDGRLRGDDDADAKVVETVIFLADGQRLALSFDLSVR